MGVNRSRSFLGEAELGFELGEEALAHLPRAIRAVPVEALEELRSPQSGIYLPAHAGRALGCHLMRSPRGNVKALPLFIEAFLPIDDGSHPAFENLESLGLLWMQVFGRHPGLARVARLHLEQLAV